MKANRLLILLLPFFFSSCSAVEVLGARGVFIVFIILAIVLCIMLYLTFQKKKKMIAVSMFAEDTQKILQNIEDPNEKIEALQYLIDKLKNDKEYTKNVKWKDTLIVRTYLNMAAIYYGINDFDKVIETYSRVLDIDPKHSMSYYNRGSVYSNTGHLDKALDDLNKAVLLLSTYPNVYNNRGLVYYKKGEYEKAIEDFNKTLQLEESSITYYNRANCYQALGKENEAIVDYQKYLELDPEDKINLRNEVENVIKTLSDKNKEE